MSWPQSRVDRLAALLIDGYTAAQAAYVMDCTRNSVISAANRHKLKYEGKYDPGRLRRPDERKHERKPKDQRPPPKAKPERGGRSRFLKSFASLPPVPTKSVPPAATERRCTLLELTNSTCRWPYGDPGAADFYFCGSPDADLSSGVPYCPLHTKASINRREAA